MKDYKRLTERDDSLCIDCANIGFCRKTCIMQARYERLQFLENEIESGEIDYVADSKTEQTITDLLIEFDEMGFAPTTVCENPEQYAIDWRERVRKEFTRLTEENDSLTVELEVAQRDVENLTRTLDEANDEIKALEAENEELKATLSKMETVEKELRERLEKAVELPCKIGDTVYFIPTYNGKPIWGVQRGIVQMVGITRQGYHVKIRDRADFNKTYMFRKSAFLSKEQAEARLAKLKGEEKNG